MEIANEIIRNWKSDALDLSNLGLTELPTLPEGLRILYCSNNRLDKLPDTLPSSIRLINCSYNQLTALPETLPTSLQFLNCSYNYLLRLPDPLPEGLLELYCNNNQITTVPELPPNLTELVYAYNPMTLVPRIHHRGSSIRCSSRLEERDFLHAYITAHIAEMQKHAITGIAKYKFSCIYDINTFHINRQVTCNLRMDIVRIRVGMVGFHVYSALLARLSHYLP